MSLGQRTYVLFRAATAGKSKAATNKQSAIFQFSPRAALRFLDRFAAGSTEFDEGIEARMTLEIRWKVGGFFPPRIKFAVRPSINSRIFLNPDRIRIIMDVSDIEHVIDTRYREPREQFRFSRERDDRSS